MTKVITSKFLDLLRRSALIDEARLNAFLEKTTLEHGEQIVEDHDRLADPEYGHVVDELMNAYVRPFFTVAPARPHKSIFTG